jgi:hypothetical protein
MHVTNKGRVLSLALAAIFAAGSLIALDIDKLPPDNWTVPSRVGIRTTMTDATSPRPFIGLPPCRLVDTRGNGAPITGGAFTTNEIRTWLFAGLCGLPVGTDAVSLNITVTGTGSSPFGFITVWPAGLVEPTASTLNWNAAGQTVANAAIVPLGVGGSAGRISIQSGNAGTDVIVDVNGYFSDLLGTPGNYFQLTTNSGGYTEFLQNLSTTCGGACGVYQSVGSGIAGYYSNSNSSTATGQKGLQALTSATGAGDVGVEGDAFGGSGVTYGVLGVNSSTSTESAGVFGYSIAKTLATSFTHAGVRGESSTGNGIIGVSAGSGTVGVRGDLVNGSGATLTFGILGVAGNGVVFGGGLSGSGTKAFVEPHPTDASKMIRYVSLEGPEAGTYFRGTGRTVGGKAVIDVPESFRMVTDSDGLTVQLTPTGSRFTQMTVESSDLNQIVVLSNRDVTFHYLAQGVRRAYKNMEVITDNTLFAPDSPSAKLPVYLSPDEKQRLIDNGTYNPDGTVNMKTAESAGWTKAWADRAEVDRKAAEAAAAARKLVDPIHP